jgi:hypothetical protein
MANNYPAPALLATAFALVLISSCSQPFQADKRSVESAHGINLPKSARNLQQRSWGTLGDRGILSFVEIDLLRSQQKAAGTESMPKVIVSFGRPEVRFPNGFELWSDTLLTKINRSYERTEFVLDCTVRTLEENLWCKGTPNGFMDIFHVREWLLSVGELEQLQSGPDFVEMFGDPDITQGPWENGTTCWTWRFCNGGIGPTFDASEVTAIIGGPHGKVVVLAVRKNSPSQK